MSLIELSLKLLRLSESCLKSVNLKVCGFKIFKPFMVATHKSPFLLTVTLRTMLLLSPCGSAGLYLNLLKEALSGINKFKPSASVPIHILPCLSSTMVLIKFPLILFRSAGLLRKVVKVYLPFFKDIRVKPSVVPTQILPLRSPKTAYIEFPASPSF
ncbi:hypothetical protein D3C86_608520 [compost metagenome]